MTPTEWQRIQDIVTEALNLSQPERAKFLDASCGVCLDLRQQIDRLLHSYEEAGSFLEKSAAASASQTLDAYGPREGERIGAYRIENLMGHGGMGSVYRASRVDDHFRQQVAIKVLLGGSFASSEMLMRFRAERQILATLTHPNIARLLDGGITGSGFTYLVMEFIEGTSIDAHSLSQNLSIRERLAMFRQLCSAVQYAHQNLIVHRDIKPANVMVTSEGVPKLLDFGIAKLLQPEALGQTIAATRPAERLMTPEYASPEQIRGDAITTATDIYGLGILLYELITRQRPFSTEKLTPGNLERVICESRPTRPSHLVAKPGNSMMEKISSDLDNIVMKAIHNEADRRYASAAEFSEDIGRYLQGFPVSARIDSWGYRASKFIRRHKLATLVAVFFVVTTTVLSTSLFFQARRAKREAQTANQVSDFLVNVFEFSRPDKTQGRVNYARDLLDLGALRATGAELANQPAVQSRLLAMLGTTYRELGVLDQAERLLSQAYTIRVRLFGPSSKEAAETLQVLGEIASDRGQLDRATNDFDEVLNIYNHTLGHISEQTAEVTDDIGELKRLRGDSRGAEQSYRETIGIATQVGGPNNDQVLNAKNDLASVLAEEGKYQPAESLARQLLVTEIQLMGASNPIVGSTLDNLGYILLRLARYNEAEAAFKRALDLQRRVDGREHPAVALDLQYVGWVARELGQYDEARRLGEQSMAMAIKLEGEQAPDTIVCQGQLGLTMLAEKDVERARQLLQPNLTKALALGGTANPVLAENYDRVGQVDLASRNLFKARREIEEALAIREHFYGDNSDSVADSLNHLAAVMAAEGDFPAAERSYRKAITIARFKFHQPHTITANGLWGLGSVLMSENHDSEARLSLLEALEMRRKLLPATHPAIREVEAALALCAAQLKHSHQM